MANRPPVDLADPVHEHGLGRDADLCVQPGAPRRLPGDVLPTTLLFGLGIALLVAPLTTALMASIPVARAGLGSAINNAISRSARRS